MNPRLGRQADTGVVDEDTLRPPRPNLDESLLRTQWNYPLPPLYRRAWVLAILAWAEEYAITPLGQGDTHALVYLANALSPVYELEAPERAILKSTAGPFFPSVQWDLDRLVTQGLLDVNEAAEANEGPRHAAYCCSASGREVVRSLRGSPLVEAALPFLEEVVAAFSSSRGTDIEVGQTDPTLARNVRIGSVIDFGEWDNPADNNYALRTTEAFESANRRGFPFSERDRVHLYLRYLNRVQRGAA